jgi:AcrR family transcriptional regulator
MEAVAARARVSKATLYRRFPSKRELIAAALRTIRSARPVSETGSFRGDLRELVRREVARAKRVPHIGLLSAHLLGDMADEPELLALVRETVIAADYGMLGEIVRRGIARGELRPDLDICLASEVLQAALVFRFLTSGGRSDPLGGRNAARLVDMLLVGFANKPARSRRIRGRGR